MKLGAFFLGVTLGECPCKEISEDLGYGRVEGKNLQRTIQGTMITRMKSFIIGIELTYSVVRSYHSSDFLFVID